MASEPMKPTKRHNRAQDDEGRTEQAKDLEVILTGYRSFKVVLHIVFELSKFVVTVAGATAALTVAIQYLRGVYQ